MVEAARELVARVAQQPNGGFKVALVALATACGTIIAMLGWWISMQAHTIEAVRTTTIDNGTRLTRIETSLSNIEDDIDDIRNRNGD